MDNTKQYVDLTINGRLFPTWIMANFKKFKLPTLVVGEDDACLRKTTDDLRQYQSFLLKYLDYRSPFKDILVYHGLGTGKTATAINIYNMLYNYNPGWNVFIIVKAALHKGTWNDELQKWITKGVDTDHRMKNLIFIHYDSPFADKEFSEAVRMSDTSKKNLYIIDECHNFISNVYGNVTTQKGKRAQEIYDYIIQDKKDNDGSRIVLLSGTPAINKPFELALLFNLLRPGTFPKSESQFNQLFVNQTLHGEMNSARKNLFQRRILGLVSYYIGATPDYFAKEIPHYVDVKMSIYQRDIYKYYADVEAKARIKSKGKQETYRTYTRQACNFVFPHISQRITGEQRPRPGAFRMTEHEAEKMEHGKLKVDITGQLMDIQGYKKELDVYLKAFEEYMDNLDSEDTKAGHTLQNDIDAFHKKYNDDYDKFFEKENKSQLFTKLFESSAKAMNMIFTILCSPGPVLIYTNYVLMEGIQLMKIYLKYFGFSLWDRKGETSGKDGFRYAEYHGNIDEDVRKIYKDSFNDKNNKVGNMIKIIMISPAGVEGISLRNVRQIHIFEPYWHETRIKQMIGRGIRLLSHCDLPMDNRVVDVYRYKAIIDESIETSDQYIEKEARNKDRLINSFLDAVKEAAVDCQLFYEHNVLKQDIKCFMFNEHSLLSKQIGPAYKKDIIDDEKMNTGSNSMNSITRKVKVTKINAVKKISKDDEEPKYTSSEKYWCNLETGTVYDLELHYAIGKINRDSHGILAKLDKDTFIIDMVIPIPMVKSTR